eukprot:CFRG0124T1
MTLPADVSPFMNLRETFLSPTVLSSDESTNVHSKERLYPEWEGELFLESVERFALADPDRMSLSFLDSKAEVEKSFTRGEIWAHSTRVAEKMVNKYGIKAGDRVMIVYPPGIDFVIALVACLRLGIVLVSVYPPNPNKLDVDIPKFAHFVSDSGSRVALTTKAFKRFVNISTLTKEWPRGLVWVSTDDYKPMREIQQPPLVTGIDMKRHSSDLAIIQYTSGSTGKPKGIMISHGNISHQCQYGIISRVGSIYPDKTVEELRYVGWAPQYHDLGLFLGILGVLQGGCQSYTMSPITFIRNPTLWPIAMEKYKADFTAGPNFAYGLACKRTRDKGLTVDLKHMKIFAQGGEPAQLEAQKLVEEVWNINSTAFYNFYGQAEASACVGAMGQAINDGRISAGDLDPTILAGYIKDNNLYVTSRLKDLIIINGKNYSPNDIEICIERSFPVIRPGSSVAFQHVNAVSGKSEPNVVVVCEIRDERVHDCVLERLARDIRVRVVSDVGVPIHEVVLVKARSVPKTTSGKVQRKECAKLWGCGQLVRLQPQAQTDDTNAQQECDMLGATSFEHLLKIAGVENWDVTLSDNGVDSLALTRLIHAAQKLGIILSYEQAITCSCKQLLEKYSVIDNNALQAPKSVLLPEIKITGQKHRTSFSIFIRQCVVILCLFVIISVSAIPSAVFTNELYGYWAEWLWHIKGRAGPMAAAAVLLWMLTYTALCIVMKWVLLGKQKPGDTMLLWSSGYIRWITVQRLFGVWEHMIGRFLVDTPYINLVYWMLGADVHRTCRIKSSFRNWDLVRIGRDSTVEGMLYPHFHTKEGVVFNTIAIGQGCKLGPKSICQAPVAMEDKTIVLSSSYLAPSTTLTSGTWVGNPAEYQPTVTGADDVNETNIDDEYVPWTTTQLLTPVICVSISMGALVGFNFLLPAVSSSASVSIWTPSSILLVVSTLVVYELVGLSFLGVSVMLKWSFLCPYLTDKLSVTAFYGFFPYLKKSWVLNYWHRLFGMKIGRSTVITSIELCEPSKAHRVKIGSGCLVANSSIAPSLGPTMWTWLSGKSSAPWSEYSRKRNVVLGDGVQCLLQARIEQGVYVRDFGTVAAFTRVAPNTIIDSKITAVGNPMLCFPSTVPNVSTTTKQQDVPTIIRMPSPLYLDTKTENIKEVEMKRFPASSNYKLESDNLDTKPIGFSKASYILNKIYFLLWVFTVGGGAIVGVEVLRTLPIYSMHYIPRTMIAIIYAIVFLDLYVWGILFIFKWTLIGRSTARTREMDSAYTVSFYFIQSVEDFFNYINEPLFSGLFIMNMLNYSMGVNMSILRCTVFSSCIEAADADMLRIGDGAVLDTSSYALAHLATRQTITIESTAVLSGAVLHPGAGFLLGSLGRDSQMLPLSKPLREVHIGDGQVWAGTPAAQMLVCPINERA